MQLLFVLFSSFVFSLIIVNISYAQETNKKAKIKQSEDKSSIAQANPVLTQENISLKKKIKDLEDAVSGKDKTNLELVDRIGEIQKEKDELNGQLINLKEKINAFEKENAALESMLKLETKDLRQPQLVEADEKNLDKVIHLNLGFAYGVKGKTKEAIEEYQKALECDPNDKDTHYNLGYLLAKKNRYEEAIEEYKKALGGLPQDKEIYFNLAIIYATRIKDLQTANKYYQKFLELSAVSVKK